MVYETVCLWEVGWVFLMEEVMTAEMMAMLWAMQWFEEGTVCL